MLYIGDVIWQERGGGEALSPSKQARSSRDSAGDGGAKDVEAIASAVMDGRTSPIAAEKEGGGRGMPGSSVRSTSSSIDVYRRGDSLPGEEHIRTPQTSLPACG